jgi:hypothetical protein
MGLNDSGNDGKIVVLVNRESHTAVSMDEILAR